MPAYYRQLEIWGPHGRPIADDLFVELVPEGHLGAPVLSAEVELRRRIELAVAVLLNLTGTPVRYPPEPPYPRPLVANQFSQPWLRALLTGWI